LSYVFEIPHNQLNFSHFSNSCLETVPLSAAVNASGRAVIDDQVVPR